jgi:hypothetical protein
VKRYKDIFVAKGSMLFSALEKRDSSSGKVREGYEKEVAKIYAETTKNFIALYPLEDRIYFATKHKENSE